jgi:hypothetical protein
VLPFFLIAAAIPLVHAGYAASSARFPQPAASRAQAAQRWGVTCLMHLMQPLARLIGRLQHGLSPWRRRGGSVQAPPVGRLVLWSERWFPAEAWVARLEAAARERGAVVVRGGDFDEWDLLFRGGAFGSARTRLATEEHGGGRQLLRLDAGIHPSPTALITAVALALLAALALAEGAWIAAGVLAVLTGALGFLMLRDCTASRSAWAQAVESLKTSPEAQG